MAHDASSPRGPEEFERLVQLRYSGILHTPPEPRFDELAELAAQICEVPIALITLVDEEQQWFKSCIGWAATGSSREVAFCSHTILGADLFEVPDALADPRFAANPLVTEEPRIRFYAGAPLLTREGHALGTLCVIDRQPRQLRPEQRRALGMLSRHVVAQIELRVALAERERAELALRDSHAELERRVGERTAELRKASAGERDARLEAERARLQMTELIERVSDGFAALDREWHYTYVNVQAAAFFGRDPEQLIGRRIWDGLPEGIGERFRRTCEQAFSGQQPAVFEQHYAPSDRWFENRVFPSPEGLSIFFHEITDRKRGELKLAAERRFSDAVIQSLPGLFYVFDEGGRLLRWNHYSVHASGYSTEEFQAKNVLELIAPEDRELTRRSIESVLAEGEAQIEARLLRKDGSRLWCLFTGRRLEQDGQRCVVGVGIDITARRAAEEAVRKGERELAASREGLRALLGRLQTAREEERTRLARDLHDVLGQHLTALKMDLAWCAARLPEGMPRLAEKAGAMALLIDETIATVQRLSSDLRPAELDELGLVAALEGAAGQFQARSGIRCRFFAETEAAPAISPERATALFRIAQEALTNAARHSGATEVTLTLCDENGEMTLTVADNGRGIDPAETGEPHSLGLLGMRERAELAGGALQIRANPGGGTVVCASVPLTNGG